MPLNVPFVIRIAVIKSHDVGAKKSSHVGASRPGINQRQLRAVQHGERTGRAGRAGHIVRDPHRVASRIRCSDRLDCEGGVGGPFDIVAVFLPLVLEGPFPGRGV